jgi:hypothetical protein
MYKVFQTDSQDWLADSKKFETLEMPQVLDIKQMTSHGNIRK